MYSEIGFIFSPALGGWNNSGNTGNIYQVPIKVKVPPAQNTTQGQATPTNQGGTSQNVPQNPPPANEDGVLVYKNNNEFVGTAGIKDYYAKNVFQQNSSGDEGNEDPYIALIRYFGDRKSKSMILKAADFAYLKDLGVYPINRLWILRRFPDNCIVPNNLLAWGANAVRPISTVVGWMKDKEDNPMLSINFNEVWVDQNQMIDKVLTEILRDEFGLKLPAMMSVPGWSQGILFGMLKAMKLTEDYNATNVPTGDPNVLRVAKMREVNNQGLQSKINLTLETCYEQKYINGIDPGMAMMDILSNLFKMGTSDQRFVLTGNSPLVQQFIGNIQSSSQNIDAWMSFIKELIKAFLGGVTEFINDLKSTTAEVPPEGNAGSDTKDNQKEKNTTLGTATADPSAISGMGNLVAGMGSVLLAVTIAKYRWPLKGSIALMTGINTTPWHLTIGNPYSPIINIGNIVVGGVDVKLSNDLGFNDMPARIDVSIIADFGRPLGKQELEKMFNNGYKRVYSASSTKRETQLASSNSNASGIPATSTVSEMGNQPANTKQMINKSVNTGGF
jgi:hypothetical protein